MNFYNLMSEEFLLVVLLVYFYAALVMVFYGRLSRMFDLEADKFYIDEKGFPPAKLVGVMFFIHAITIAAESSDLGILFFPDLVYFLIIATVNLLALRYVTPVLGSWIRIYAPIASGSCFLFFLGMQLIDSKV